jgi:hypothetical protein
MASRSVARFTIDVKGTPRSVLSLGLGKHGDVFMHLHSAAHVTEAGVLVSSPSSLSYHGERIAEQRYSIHPSKESANFNTITHTLRLVTGQTIPSRQVTDAIKTKTFAPVYARRCPDLSEARYIAKRQAATTISLGSYDPKRFTLLHAVCVGSSAKQFNLGTPGNINVAQTTLGEVRIVVLWSFLCIPSHASGNIIHVLTGDPDAVEGENEKAMLKRLMKGNSARESAIFFRSIQPEATYEFLQVLRDVLPRRDLRKAELMAAYFRQPNEGAPEYIRHCRRMTTTLDRL